MVGGRLGGDDLSDDSLVICAHTSCRAAMVSSRETLGWSGIENLCALFPRHADAAFARYVRPRSRTHSYQHAVYRRVRTQRERQAVLTGIGRELAQDHRGGDYRQLCRPKSSGPRVG